MTSKCLGMQPNAIKFTINKEKFLLSDVNSEYKNLAMFAEDTYSHLNGEVLEDSLKKSKRRHFILQAVNPKANYPHPSSKRKFYEVPKNDI